MNLLTPSQKREFQCKNFTIKQIMKADTDLVGFLKITLKILKYDQIFVHHINNFLVHSSSLNFDDAISRYFQPISNSPKANFRCIQKKCY